MRYTKLFSRLAAERAGAFIPFVTLGDPDKHASLQIVEALIAGGADALEIGFPFSDPIADGPVIQSANHRSLTAGTTVDDCLEILRITRERHPDIPFGLLVYSNLVHHRGYEKFFRDVKAAGADSILIADVPVEMADVHVGDLPSFLEVSKSVGLPMVFIAPPNADAATLANVARLGNCYTYLLSRAGVTGTDVKAGMPIDSVLRTLKDHGGPPAVLGFGISSPAQVSAAIQAGATGAISGSAVVKLIERYRDDIPAACSEIKNFVSAMKTATKI